jgi:hypothetical protein
MQAPPYPARTRASGEDLTLDSLLQDVFRLMLYKQLQALQEKIANSDYQIIAIRLLLKTLHKRLHLPVDDKNFQHATQPVSQLDFGITEEDRDDLLKMSVYASWRRPGSEPFTTYASLLWKTLEQVDVASSVYASMPALLQPRIGVTSRNLYLTPEIGQTPHINVTPNINTTPTLSGTPRTSLTPLYHNSPIHSPDQRDFAGIEAACLACEEVIVRSFLLAHPE